MSIAMRRYMIALLWSWSGPALIGGAVGYTVSIVQTIATLEAMSAPFASLLTAAIQACQVAQ